MEDTCISICIPAYNEERNLGSVVEGLISALSGCLNRFELIIVDDGSYDKTALIAQELTNKYAYVILIRHPNNLGIGRCYRDALAVAQGEYFTWFPSDGENLPQEITQCLAYLKKSRVVTCHHIAFDQRSVSRRMLSRFYTFVLNKYFGLKLAYYNGLSIISTAQARTMVLVADGFFCNAEIVIRAARSGYEILEMAAPLGRRLHGKSKALTFRSLRRAFKDFLQIMNNRGALEEWQKS